MCVNVSLCTTIVHNTAQNSSDNFPLILLTIIIAQTMSTGGWWEKYQEILSNGVLVIRMKSLFVRCGYNQQNQIWYPPDNYHSWHEIHWRGRIDRDFPKIYERRLASWHANSQHERILKITRHFKSCTQDYGEKQYKPNSITLAGSKLVADRFEAKLHYAIWFEAGRRQVRSWSAASFEPDSVMEFGRGPLSSC